MADNKAYYAILGVSEKASYHEIKRSYRKLARKYHPDRNRSAQGDDMIKKINAAFEVLSDEQKRTEYDRADALASVLYQPEPEERFDDPPAPAAPPDTVFADFFGGPYFLDTPKGRFHIIVEPSLCMAFGSCETLAPKVFSVEKHKRVNPKAKVECETCADYEKIYAAAATCPTKAIKIIDRYTGEQMYP